MEGVGRQRTARATRQPAAASDPACAVAAQEAAMRILNAAAQSAAGLRRRLLHRGFTDEAADAAILEMKRFGYIDDDALARTLVRKRRRSGHGTARIVADLRAHNFDSVVIDTVTADLDDDIDVALITAQRIWKSESDHPARDAMHRRVAGMLQRRGFSGEVVGRVLRELQTR